MLDEAVSCEINPWLWIGGSHSRRESNLCGEPPRCGFGTHTPPQPLHTYTTPTHPQTHTPALLGCRSDHHPYLPPLSPYSLVLNLWRQVSLEKGPHPPTAVGCEAKGTWGKDTHFWIQVRWRKKVLWAKRHLIQVFALSHSVNFHGGSPLETSALHPTYFFRSQSSSAGSLSLTEIPKHIQRGWGGSTTPGHILSQKPSV